MCQNTFIGNGETCSIPSCEGLKLTAGSKNSGSLKSKKQNASIKCVGHDNPDEPDNGHFHGITELLAKCDNNLYDHL